MKFPAEASCL